MNFPDFVAESAVPTNRSCPHITGSRHSNTKSKEGAEGSGHLGHVTMVLGKKNGYFFFTPAVKKKERYFGRRGVVNIL